MAGMGRMRFAVANAAGAVVRAAVFTAIGFYAGEWWNNTSGLVHLLAAAAMLAAASSWLLLRRRRGAADAVSDG